MGKFLVPPLQCWVESAPNPLCWNIIKVSYNLIAVIAFVQITPAVNSRIGQASYLLGLNSIFKSL